MKPINLCILGCGAVARLHSRIARTLRREVRLSYASRSQDKARLYNHRFKGVGAFSSYEAACADPSVDAIFICTPHAFHVEHARLAASHRKPLLIEKPVTRTLEELKVLEATVAGHGVPCMVAENYYFKPLVPTVRRYIDRGDIGEPLYVELNKTGRARNTGWRTDAELMGGGALLEGGVHWINLLTGLGGPATQVLAAQPEVPYASAAPFEDNVQVLVRFQSGAVGKLLHSWNTVNRVGGLSLSKVYGTEGNLFFESNGLWVASLGKRKRFRLPGLLDIMGYRAMLRAFAKSIRDHVPPPMTLDVARRDLEIVHAAYRSLRTKRFETVSLGQLTQPQVIARMDETEETEEPANQSTN